MSEAIGAGPGNQKGKRNGRQEGREAGRQGSAVSRLVVQGIQSATEASKLYRVGPSEERVQGYVQG